MSAAAPEPTDGQVDHKDLPADARELWKQAFLAVLPVAMAERGWAVGDKPITSGRDKVKLLAADWADSAVDAYLARFPSGA